MLRKKATNAAGEQRFVYCIFIVQVNLFYFTHTHSHRFICQFLINTYRLQYSKRTKQWRPVNILEPKAYAYIPELLVNIFRKRQTIPGSITQRLTRSDDDPRNIARNIAPTPRPSIEEALDAHKSRFGT